MKTIFSSLFIFFILCSYVSNHVFWDDKDIDYVWQDMTDNETQNQVRRYMIFDINKSEINDPEYFRRVVSDFFLSNGFQSGIYNIKNKKFIAYLSKEDPIKIKVVREYFGKAFNSISWFDKSNKDHDFRKIKS